MLAFRGSGARQGSRLQDATLCCFAAAPTFVALPEAVPHEAISCKYVILGIAGTSS